MYCEKDHPGSALHIGRHVRCCSKKPRLQVFLPQVFRLLLGDQPVPLAGVDAAVELSLPAIEAGHIFPQPALVFLQRVQQ